MAPAIGPAPTKARTLLLPFFLSFLGSAAGRVFFWRTARRPDSLKKRSCARMSGGTCSISAYASIMIFSVAADDTCSAVRSAGAHGHI